MRIKELADLAGTTVRTVRHYHHEGLLSVPPTVRGIRDYGLDHLARLLRIRWLADSGLSLATIAESIGDPTAPTYAEAASASSATDAEPAGASRLPDAVSALSTTLHDIDARLADLTRQRERVAALLYQAQRGDGVSPLPPALAAIYDRLSARMPTARARLAVAAERKVAVVLALRGMLPEPIEAFIEELTAEDEDDIVEMFAAFADLSACPPAEIDRRSAQVVDSMLQVIDRHESAVVAILEAIPRGPVGRTVVALIARLATLGYPSPGHRRFLAETARLVSSRPALRAALDDTGGNLVAMTVQNGDR